MSDETTAPTETTPAPTEQQTPESKTFTQEQVNALLAEQKRKVSSGFADYADLKTKASEFDKLAESQKTELQKANERAEAAERLLAETAAEALRNKVLAAHEIPADWQEFVFGATEEELTAKAEKVKSLIPAPAQETAPLLRELYIPGEGAAPALALNSDQLEADLKAKLGIA